MKCLKDHSGGYEDLNFEKPTPQSANQLPLAFYTDLNIYIFVAIPAHLKKKKNKMKREKTFSLHSDIKVHNLYSAFHHQNFGDSRCLNQFLS